MKNKIKFAALILSFSLANLSCTSAITNSSENKQYSPPYDSLPPYQEIVRNNESLVSIEIEVSCAGVWGVRKVPDGWTVTTFPKGENYIITFTPPTSLKSSAANVSLPEISTIFRGQWSDCYNLELKANLVSGETPFTRKFKIKNLMSGPWVEY